MRHKIFLVVLNLGTGPLVCEGPILPGHFEAFSLPQPIQPYLTLAKPVLEVGVLVQLGGTGQAAGESARSKFKRVRSVCRSLHSLKPPHAYRLSNCVGFTAAS